MARELHVDGTSPDDGLFFGADETSLPPFVVFDADQQQNIAGPFNTAEDAEKHRQEILAGATPRLDAERLRKWVDAIDDGSVPDIAKIAKRFINS